MAYGEQVKNMKRKTNVGDCFKMTRCPHPFYRANQKAKIDLPIFCTLLEPRHMLKGNLAAKLTRIFHRVMQFVMLVVELLYNKRVQMLGITKS